MFYCAIYRDKNYWDRNKLVEISNTYDSVIELHRNNQYRFSRLIEILSAPDRKDFCVLLKEAIRKAREPAR